VDSFLVILVIAFAWFFQSFVGFGAGIFIVGFLSLFYNPKEVVVTSTVINLLGNILVFRSLRLFANPDFILLGWLVLGSGVGIAISSHLLIGIRKEILSVVIGVFILFLGFFDYLVQKGAIKVKLRRNFPTGFLSGFLGGFFAGLVGMGGPPPVVFLNQVCSNHDTARITLALYFTFNVLTRTAFYLIYGGWELFNKDLILTSLVGLPIGILLGIRLPRYFSPVAMKKIVSVSILGAGFFLLVKGLKEFK